MSEPPSNQRKSIGRFLTLFSFLSLGVDQSIIIDGTAPIFGVQISVDQLNQYLPYIIMCLIIGFLITFIGELSNYYFNEYKNQIENWKKNSKDLFPSKDRIRELRMTIDAPKWLYNIAGFWGELRFWIEPITVVLLPSFPMILGFIAIYSHYYM